MRASTAGVAPDKQQHAARDEGERGRDLRHDRRERRPTRTLAPARGADAARAARRPRTAARPSAAARRSRRRDTRAASRAARRSARCGNISTTAASNTPSPPGTALTMPTAIAGRIDAARKPGNPIAASGGSNTQSTAPASAKSVTPSASCASASARAGRAQRPAANLERLARERRPHASTRDDRAAQDHAREQRLRRSESAAPPRSPPGSSRSDTPASAPRPSTAVNEQKRGHRRDLEPRDAARGVHPQPHSRTREAREREVVAERVRNERREDGAPVGDLLPT